MQPDARRQIRAVFILFAPQPRRIGDAGDRHSDHVAARPPRRSTIASPCSPREAKVLVFSVAPFAPVVKRTSRRSPEPQVRVRFPAGALPLPQPAEIATFSRTASIWPENLWQICGKSGGAANTPRRLPSDDSRRRAIMDSEPSRLASGPAIAATGGKAAQGDDAELKIMSQSQTMHLGAVPSSARGRWR